MPEMREKYWPKQVAVFAVVLVVADVVADLLCLCSSFSSSSFLHCHCFVRLNLQLPSL